ncbi:MAG: sensor histidine kinase [Bacteroidales bacterium]|nr:sensor histidine kinase [Bacteroidales bacterium]
MTRSLARHNPRRLLTVLAHVIFIIIICILPEVLLRMAWPGRTGGLPWGVYAKSGVMVAVFYINYFVIIPRTLVRNRRWVSFVAWNIALIAAATVLMYYIGEWGWPHHRPRHRHAPDQMHRMIASASFMLRDAITLLLSVALSVAIRLSGRWLELERRQQQMIASRRENELEQLRMQLNPHFLFNTLNSIYALIEINPAEAQTAVHELSQLLRHVVYENPERVALSSEIDFVRNYISLMRLRMGSRPVNFEVDTDGGDVGVAPLLFVTLVENAFKHGNTPDRTRPIDIYISARDGLITCRTVNCFDPDGRAGRSAGGVGLANLRRRIELIYGRDAGLETSTDNDTFTATLRIKLKK